MDTKITYTIGFVLVSCILTLHLREVSGAPFLLGNEMTALSVIPRTEEQATALLDFLKDNPQYGANFSRTVQINNEELILVPAEDVTKVQSGLEEIGLQLKDSNNAYQISEGEN